MPSPCIVSGNLQTLTSGQISNGQVRFQLSNIGTGNPLGITGTSLFPQAVHVATSDGTGAFSLSLWGNDNINPANTIYLVTFIDNAGNSVGPIQYSITGASVNLNTAIPVTSTSPAVFAFSITNTGNINNSLYVGAAIASWGGGDIGAQINAAYASLPASGGTITVIPQANGAPYTFTTPIVFNVPGKYVLLLGYPAPGNQSAGLGVGGSMGGVTLNFNPASLTTPAAAITMDYVPSIGGGTATTHGIRDLTLVGGPITTLATSYVSGGPGAGSALTGIQIGGTYSGMQNGVIQGSRVAGFSVGISFVPSGGGISWGVAIRDCGIAANTTGISYNGSFEKQYIDNCFLLFNGYGVVETNGVSLDIFIRDCSFDANLFNAINQFNNSNIYVSGCHFENPGGTTLAQAHYHTSQGGHFYYNQCFILDDRGSGGAQDWYFTTSSQGVASFIDCTFFQAVGPSPAATVILTVGGANTVVTKFNNLSPARSPTLVTGTANWIDIGGFGVVQAKRLTAHSGTPLVAGNFTLTGWGSTATITLLAGTDQAWTMLITCQGSGITGQPTITLVFHDGTWTVQPICISKIQGGTGSLNTPLTDAPVATQNIITFQGTPVSGLTYLISSIAIGT